MAELSLTLERTFAVSRDTMWQLWTDETHACQWMRPSLTDYGPTKATIDARAGGQYRFELIHGSDEMSVIVGEYLEVEAPELLVYTWSWEGDPHVSRVEVRFDEVPDGTRVNIFHSTLASPESVAAHELGWIGCLNTLSSTIDSVART
ncbi:SRPBCC domain-containing protein [Salinibacterium sp. G-O1]|uniref:SRPBCC family protein n=1 Tax=Salinibacterium sp. G-O1 TaxID=3046208 RepID=UPI0024BA1256|nr:SRPBCC domain-containing protein [Salinibacterium sp. G-O1]MDJ0334959.1 SRPBCC domain-containing protein [Salinibacterium sp. G-O1]